jgi:transposase-like protein
MRYSFQDFMAEYPTDEACLDKIMDMKFGADPMCPGCGAETKFHRITKRRAYACQICGHHVYPCVDTPFEKSRTSLQKWFFAMYLFSASKNGVSSTTLTALRAIGANSSGRSVEPMSTFHASIFGNMSRSFPTATTCGRKITALFFRLWFLA